jgi:hypothetical protein
LSVCSGWALNKLRGFRGALSRIWETIKGGARRAWAAIGDKIVSPIKHAVVGVKRALNWVIKHINKVLKFLHVPQIPRLSEGGMANARTNKANDAAFLAGHARGGAITTGAMSGDSVPALLEKGEYVLNRKAVRAVGHKQLDALNYAAAPRFQSGGIVAFGRRLQREGYSVGEHPAFGGVAPVHTAGSYHYRNQALDINAYRMPGGEAKNLDRLYRRLKGMSGIVELLWRTAGHYDHLHVAFGKGGPGGIFGFLKGIPGKILGFVTGGAGSVIKKLTGLFSPAIKMLPEWFKPAGRGLLNMIAKGSQKMIANAAAAEGSEAGVGARSGAATRSQMVRWAKMALRSTGLAPVA